MHLMIHQKLTNQDREREILVRYIKMNNIQALPVDDSAEFSVPLVVSALDVIKTAAVPSAKSNEEYYCLISFPR
jgi:hypothetical protein